LTHFRKEERHLRSVLRCFVEQPPDQRPRMTAGAVRGFGEHGADTADAHGPLIKYPGKVVLHCAGDQVSTLDERVSSLATGRPGGFHLGGVEFAVRLATQAFVPDRVSRLENAVEDDAFGANNL